MKKLYEFTGYVKYSVVVAADSEEAARKAFNALGEDWPSSGDKIGPDNPSDVELFDVREITGLRGDKGWTEEEMMDIYNDDAHIVA